MSWSIRCVGTPEKICAKLDEASERFADNSKIEFDDALPGLKQMVLQNFDRREGAKPIIVELEASGHGYFEMKDGQKIPLDRTCRVSFRCLGAVDI